MRKRATPAFLIRLKQRRWAARLEVPAGWDCRIAAAHDNAFRVAKALPLPSLCAEAPKPAALETDELDARMQAVCGFIRAQGWPDEPGERAELLMGVLMRLNGPYDALYRLRLLFAQ